MDFYAVLDQVMALLRQRGRASYRALKMQFQLDDEQLEALKEELIEGQRIAVDEGGKVLVWAGAAAAQNPGPERSGESAQGPAPTYTDSGTARPHAPRVDTAERRQLTVMFCDLVGSTVLSTHLDPEDYHTVVQRYHQTCEAVIQRYDGFVPQHLGDGLLVYFGYPTAHEDDAQRAVRAALDIVEAIQRLSFPTIRLPQPVQVRIGIHTGLVVIGEIGGSETREMLALGETPNLAARVQGAAAPNTVAMSAATHRLVQGLFECQELGLHELKGFTTPVAMYRVVRASEAQNRFEAAVRTGLTPLVGREEELGLLRRRWEQAKAGTGQVVLLSGEPGIGKSRLVQELKEYLGHEGATRIEFRCSPYHQNSALYPLIEHLQHLLQFARDDTPVTKLEKLYHTLSHYRFPQAETVPLLAALLSLPHPQDHPPITLSPQKQKEKTQAALVAWLVEEAERHPVSTIWEDLHWVDPSTLEVLTLFLDQVPTARVLGLLTFRPEFIPPWGNRSHLSQLTLSRLGHQQAEAMVKRVTNEKSLPAEVVRHIVAKTDGVPLFVEELTKTVIASGLLTTVQDHYELRGPLPPLAIPSTLHDSLMARLDRLAPVKELAQLGAVLGREFSYELLHAVSPLPEDTLQQGLRQLVETELVFQSGLPPQARYLFKHALVQDTAYQSLLKSRRQQLHHQIARVLEERFAEIKEIQPELLAHHYTEAGLIAQAIPYWQQAGQRAIERSAHSEAISHLTTGLELLKTLPDTPERAQQELMLQIALGAPLVATKSYGAPEVESVYTRARALCQQMGETPQLFPVVLGLWAFYFVRAEFKTAREFAEQLLTLAQRLQTPLFLVAAHEALGASHLWLGEFTPARVHLEQGIRLYNPQRRRSHAFRAVQDPGVACLSWLALALWCLGYPDQAQKRVHEAVALAQELAHPYSLAFALSHVAVLLQKCREEHATQKWAESAIALCTEQGFPFFAAVGTILRGWALAVQGQGEEGIAQIHQGLAVYRPTESGINWPQFLLYLADAHGKAGQADEGQRAVAEALAVVDKTGEQHFQAELYRVKGELTLQKLQVSSFTVHVHEGSKSEVRGPESGAEECFLKALEIARKQQARSWELRAVMSLSRLWQQQGKKDEARQMLAEVYGWFTEGFDTKDLQEAKALLAVLDQQ